MKRIPIVATIVVALAVAAMIALGLWQLLDRLPQKEAFLAQLAANPARPVIPFPQAGDDTLLFRRATGNCAAVRSRQLVGAGKAGFRVIAQCSTDVGTTMPVQLGTTRDPAFRSTWAGGPVTGYINHAPSSQSLIGSVFHREAKPLMLVADTPPPGLAANGEPDLGTVPNNHLAYAWQWFFFAVIATVIYGLALRRRWHD
ncbi:SURF1 family protein [Sphingomonas oligophenolica]|uniref:SURF1-like protein n=1 Tax=Sphingomonas oligophenolica TaxID=301154 RepID=A0A502CFB4_9SPHN|nr:SURF1 family protein [Sphingomonas oligophenolica]TPG10421.1 SURF1 family protein [Sphingomonas oligophenolica]